MPAKITLEELVDLSIGTPEIGAVNFNALHTLLVAMLKHLNLQDIKIELPPQVTEQSRSAESIRASISGTPIKEKRKVSISKQPSSGRPTPHIIEAQMKDLGGQVQDLGKQVQAIESQVLGIENHVQDIGSQVDVFGEQIAALDKLPSGTDLLEKTPSGSRVSDMWQMMQMKKKVEANEDGISKALKDYRSMITDMEERISNLEKLVNNQENNMEVMSQKMSLYPEDNSIVTWPDLEQALVSGRRSSLPEDRPSAPETSLTTTDMPPDKASQVSKKMSSAIEIPPTPQEAAGPRQIGTEHSPLPSSTPPLTLVSPTPPSAPSGISQFPPVAPEVSQVTPGIGQPPPGVGVAPSGVGQVAPGIGQPPPGVDLIAPGIGQPPPGVGLIAPGIGQPPPEVDLIAPGIGQPPPGVGVAPSGIGQPPPGVDVAPSGVGQVAPGIGQPPPGVDLAPSGMGLVAPGIGQPPPGVGQPPSGIGQPFPIAPGIGQPAVTSGIDQQVPTAVGPVQPVPGTLPTYQPTPGAPPTYPSVSGTPPILQPVPGTPPTHQPGPIAPVASSAYPAYPGAPGSYPEAPGTYPGTPYIYQPQGGAPSTYSQVPGTPPTTQPKPGAPPTYQPAPETPPTSQPVSGAPPTYLPGPRAPGAGQPFPIDPVPGQRIFVAPGIGQPAPKDQPIYGAPPTHVPGPGAQTFPGVPLHTTMSHPSPLLVPVAPGTGSLAPTGPTAIPGQDQSGAPQIPLQPASGIPGSDQPGLVASRTAPSSEQPRDQAGTQFQLPSDSQPGFVPSSMSPRPSSGPSYPPYMPPQPSMVTQPPLAAAPYTYPAPQYQYPQIRSQRVKDSLGRESISFPFALETLRLMGELTNYYLILKEQMGALDEDAGHSELEKLQFLIGKLTSKTIPDDMLEQLRGLKALTKEIQEEREKMKLMQRILEGEEEDAEEDGERSGQLGLQLGILRVNVNDIEKELALLRERQEQGKAIVEQSVNEATLYLQEQLDKLRMIIESMLSSSSTLLSMSMAPSKTPAPLDPSKVDSHTTCPACSLDLSQQVSRLVQRYEQLQDMVNNLMVSRPARKYQFQNQDEELLGHIQATILQVQGDCEKLNITTGNLIEDHRQKQKDIDVLYQSLEKLEKEKANREHLEMEIDVKADKTALAAKVSRIQFDATTEQLNQMMQELLTKMTGQEKDWKKVLDKLLVEMDTKLDRLELDPVKKMLEEKWKALRSQLKEQSPLYQSEEAAMMRRQLLAHFHCLSCDRPLETAVPGPIIPSVPSGPGLPAHRSKRPYTIYELEQVRQQSRNMRLGTAFQRMELGQLERSVGRMHSMHSKMLMDIEKVQIHFGGSVKASSQMIRELIQAQCLGSSYYKRIQDMPDYSYMSVPRRCGGSHTLTFPYRRYPRLQNLTQYVCPPEDVQASLKHEVDILGLDGHIYKGRLDARLPGIPNKDSPMKNKPKNLSSVGQSRQSPSRPQSAQMMVASMTSQQTKGRPVSSQGRLTQPNATHPPSPTTINPSHVP